MPLWGKTTADERKPVWLEDVRRERVIGDERGWVYIRPDGIEEVLVAISNLPSGLGAPTADLTRFPSLTLASGVLLPLNVSFNEPVVVSGNPTITASGGTVFTYNDSRSVPDAGLLVFTVTTSGLPTGDNSFSVPSGLSIALAGGTITDATDGSTAADLPLNNTNENINAIVTLT